MVSQTFKNLKRERQEEILMIAYGEFALKGYDSASLTVIIKKCNLAKGSFYRYFASKKELYAFLIEDAAQRRLKNLDNLLNTENADFFELIKQNFLEKIKFDLEYPLIGGFLYKISHEKDNNEVSGLITRLYNRMITQTQTIIESEPFSSQLLKMDTRLLAFQVFYMQLWLYEYVAMVFNIDYETNIKQKRPVLSISEEELKKLIESSVYILKHGIKAEKK